MQHFKVRGRTRLGRLARLVAIAAIAAGTMSIKPAGTNAAVYAQYQGKPGTVWVSPIHGRQMSGYGKFIFPAQPISRSSAASGSQLITVCYNFLYHQSGNPYTIPASPGYWADDDRWCGAWWVAAGTTLQAPGRTFLGNATPFSGNVQVWWQNAAKTVLGYALVDYNARTDYYCENSGCTVGYWDGSAGLMFTTFTGV